MPWLESCVPMKDHPRALEAQQACLEARSMQVEQLETAALLGKAQELIRELRSVTRRHEVELLRGDDRWPLN